MKLPAGRGDDSGGTMKLNKSLHDLEQPWRSWNAKVVKDLEYCGFEQGMVDPCGFRLMDGNIVKILLVDRVDDVLVICNEEDCEKLARDLTEVSH